jgi:hypothetical protein
MEKEKKYVKVPYIFDWDYRIKLTELKKDIEDLENLGVTDIEIECVNGPFDSYIEITALCERLETDEEFNFRQKLEEANAKIIRDNELRQLQYLQEKYNK